MEQPWSRSEQALQKFFSGLAENRSLTKVDLNNNELALKLEATWPVALKLIAP